jgi:hypothetical protein
MLNTVTNQQGYCGAGCVGAGGDDNTDQLDETLLTQLLGQQSQALGQQSQVGSPYGGGCSNGSNGNMTQLGQALPTQLINQGSAAAGGSCYGGAPNCGGGVPSGGYASGNPFGQGGGQNPWSFAGSAPAGAANASALSQFAQGVGGEAASAGDNGDSVCVGNLAASLMNGSCSTPTPDASVSGCSDPSSSSVPASDCSVMGGSNGASSTAPATAFSGGDENAYQTDVGQAQDLTNQAADQYDAAMKTQGLSKDLLLDTAEQTAGKAEELGNQAAGVATSESEQNTALSYQAAGSEAAADDIWQSGNAGPGHKDHDEYDSLMETADTAYTSVANETDSPSSARAQQLASDIETMKSATDTNVPGPTGTDTANQFSEARADYMSEGDGTGNILS